MSSDKIIQKEYEAFLREILHNQEVWLLQNEEGIACQNSADYPERMSVLIWSNGILAESEREGEFENLQAETLSLYQFIFYWLPNMQEENVICSLNWASSEGGLEVEPKDLLKHLKLILPEDLQEEYRKRLDSETS